MATVTGTLTNFGLAALVGFSPRIIFAPNTVAVSPDRIMAKQPIVVPVGPSGNFSVELAATVNLRPEAWYDISIEYLNPDGGYSSLDFAEFKLRVPTAGGDIPDLLDIPAVPAQVWVDVNPPTSPTPGTLWLNPSTGDLKRWV